MKDLSEIAHWMSSRYAVLILRRAFGRGIEIVRYAFVRPARDQRFHVVSAQRNMGAAALKCLESVYRQRYPKGRVRHIFVDDASEDGTSDLIEKWLQDHPGHCVEFIRNPVRRGMLANNMHGFSLAQNNDIGVELNGDDWLPDRQVLRFLNKVYADDAAWMTYNTVRRVDGRIPVPLAPKRRIVRERTFRSAPWTTSALHTFRMPLFRRLDPRCLIDPATGYPWEFSQDQAMYLPMLEMAGPHSRHVYRITYTYNFHRMSDENRDRPTQLETTRRIRELPRYPELTSLAD